jgi:hypothetical protein
MATLWCAVLVIGVGAATIAVARQLFAQRPALKRRSALRLLSARPGGLAAVPNAPDVARVSRAHKRVALKAVAPRPDAPRHRGGARRAQWPPSSPARAPTRPALRLASEARQTPRVQEVAQTPPSPPPQAVQREAPGTADFTFERR